ncbi:hypothetical protein GCM10027047_19880 [Rhodococcus aerolatus]
MTTPSGDAAVADELARWRAERRRLVRTHHPDAGGSAEALERALATHDRDRPAAHPGPAPAPPARAEVGDIVFVSTRRGRSPVRRAVRRVVDAARDHAPRRLPGARRSARY